MTLKLPPAKKKTVTDENQNNTAEQKMEEENDKEEKPTSAKKKKNVNTSGKGDENSFYLCTFYIILLCFVGTYKTIHNLF